MEERLLGCRHKVDGCPGKEAKPQSSKGWGRERKWYGEAEVAMPWSQRSGTGRDIGCRPHEEVLIVRREI